MTQLRQELGTGGVRAMGVVVVLGVAPVVVVYVGILTETGIDEITTEGGVSLATE